MSPRVSQNVGVKLPGERWVGDFILQEELGRGGMGVVYKATRPSDGTVTAIKILPIALSLDDGRRLRFEREGRLAQQVRHPHLVSVEESGRLEDGTLYLRMELLKGPTLRSAIDSSGGRLGAKQALTVCSQIAQGMAAIHRHGILHRDVKPSNVMWVDERCSDAKLLDFGIARAAEETDELTADRVAIGTARYMSPEQCRGTSQLTAATDLYALGVVLFESLVGRHPLVDGADSREELLELHQLGAPRRIQQFWSSAPIALVELIDALLHRDPDRRPDAKQTAERLSALIPLVPEGPLPIPIEDSAASTATSDQTEDPQAPDLGTFLDSVQGKRAQKPALLKRKSRVLLTIGGSLGAVLVLLGATEGMLRWSTGKGTVAFVGWLAGNTRIVDPPDPPMLIRIEKTTPPEGMVEIAGGRYLQGSTKERMEAERKDCLAEETESTCTEAMFDRELGPREVVISPFFLDRTEVTNDAFVAWLNSGRRSIEFAEGHILRLRGKQIASTHGTQTGIAKEGDGYVVKPGMGQRPVVNVSWVGALNYCADQGKSLPTEAEFEYVASRHGTARYPWGNQDPTCQDAISLGHEQFMRCEGSTLPAVGTMSMDVTPEGVHDLGGSVREWLLDRFVQRYSSCSPCVDPVAAEDPVESDPSGARAVRGGAFETSKVTARAAFRSRAYQDNVYESIGFRCAMRTHGLQKR